MELDKSDIAIINRLSNALFYEVTSPEQSAADTLAAVVLQELSAERAVEEVSKALLVRSSQLGRTSVSHSVFAHRFFILPHEQRLVLIGLHLGKWSYLRLSRILGRDRDEVQKLAWKARVEMSYDSSYPSAPVSKGLSCPEYDSRKPWTQRFLDGETGTTGDCLFLQRHLLECSGCREALARTRETYYRVSQELDERTEEPLYIKELQQVLTKSPLQKYPSERTFIQSLSVFVSPRKRLLRVGISLLLFLSFCFRGLILSCFHHSF